jgi:hypothetical protein
MNTIAVNRPGNGTPQQRLDQSGNDDSQRNAPDGLARKPYRSFGGFTAEAMREGENAARRSVAVRIENREQKNSEHDQYEGAPEPAGGGDRPRGNRTGVGADGHRKRFGAARGQGLPLRRNPLANQRDARDPFRRRTETMGEEGVDHRGTAMRSIQQCTMNTTRTRNIMIATARPRRPPVSRCSRSKAGQVAMAIVVAQIVPLRNGSSVQKLPASRMPITRTNSTTRVMSVDESDCIEFLTCGWTTGSCDDCRSRAIRSGRDGWNAQPSP